MGKAALRSHTMAGLEKEEPASRKVVAETHRSDLEVPCVPSLGSRHWMEVVSRGRVDSGVTLGAWVGPSL